MSKVNTLDPPVTWVNETVCTGATTLITTVDVKPLTVYSYSYFPTGVSLFTLKVKVPAAEAAAVGTKIWPVASVIFSPPVGTDNVLNEKATGVVADDTRFEAAKAIL